MNNHKPKQFANYFRHSIENRSNDDENNNNDNNNNNYNDSNDDNYNNFIYIIDKRPIDQ